jgi:hypothetical protein
VTCEQPFLHAIILPIIAVWFLGFATRGMMSNYDITHLLELKNEYAKRLRVREIQYAKLGVSADPSIVTEIAELRASIEDLDKKISGLQPDQSKFMVQNQEKSGRKQSAVSEGTSNAEVFELLTLLENKKRPLSKIIPQVLVLARGRGAQILEELCRNELKGWNKMGIKYSDIPDYRRVIGWISVDGIGGFGLFQLKIGALTENANHKRVKVPVLESISEVEERLTERKLVSSYKMPIRLISKNSKISNFLVFVYIEIESYARLSEVIRGELRTNLLDLL